MHHSFSLCKVTECAATVHGLLHPPSAPPPILARLPPEVRRWPDVARCLTSSSLHLLKQNQYLRACLHCAAPWWPGAGAAAAFPQFKLKALLGTHLQVAGIKQGNVQKSTVHISAGAALSGPSPAAEQTQGPLHLRQFMRKKPGELAKWPQGILEGFRITIFCFNETLRRMQM